MPDDRTWDRQELYHKKRPEHVHASSMFLMCVACMQVHSVISKSLIICQPTSAKNLRACKSPRNKKKKKIRRHPNKHSRLRAKFLGVPYEVQHPAGGHDWALASRHHTRLSGVTARGDGYKRHSVEHGCPQHRHDEATSALSASVPMQLSLAIFAAPITRATGEAHARDAPLPDLAPQVSSRRQETEFLFHFNLLYLWVFHNEKNASI